VAKDKKQAAEESAEQSPKTKTGKGKKIVLILVLVLLVGTGGVAAYKHFLGGGLFSQGSQAVNASQSQNSQEEEKSKTAMVSLPQLLVNLADPLGKRYLKMGVNLEVRGQEAAKDIEARMPRVKDSLILLLSSKTYDDLSSMQDKLTLKSQIAERLNQIMEESVVKRVYFTEFIIQ